MKRFLILNMSLVVLFAVARTAVAEPLRYAVKPGQVVPYRMTITVKTPSALETMKGVIVYTGRKSDGQTLTVGFAGGLSKSVKSSAPAGPPFRGGFRGPGGPPIPRGPFDQPDFRGLVPSQSTLVLTSTGEIESMQGDTQLPWLLGNLSLLPFEPLPVEDVREWKSGNALSITSSSESSRFGPRFGPFARDNDEKVKSGGGESAEYRITGEQDGVVSVEKSYSLSSPAANADETGYEMKGTGTWTFSRTDGAPQSTDFKMDLVISK
ncbi:MAG: hypothetical protein KDA89_18510, partial [Planctomycetaceae bacterium]|nr:hypothetical protein [Planctomycetaceae bacterium]